VKGIVFVGQMIPEGDQFVGSVCKKRLWVSSCFDTLMDICSKSFRTPRVNIVVYLGVWLLDRVWIGELDLLTTCTHYLELQVITVQNLHNSWITTGPAKPSSSLLCHKQQFPGSGF
jgi:hypothetical protein